MTKKSKILGFVVELNAFSGMGEKDEMDNWLTEEDFIPLYSRFYKNPDFRKVMKKVNKLDSNQIKDLDRYISNESKLKND